MAYAAIVNKLGGDQMDYLRGLNLILRMDAQAVADSIDVNCAMRLFPRYSHSTLQLNLIARVCRHMAHTGDSWLPFILAAARCIRQPAGWTEVVICDALRIYATCKANEMDRRISSVIHDLLVRGCPLIVAYVLFLTAEQLIVIDKEMLLEVIRACLNTADICDLPAFGTHLCVVLQKLTGDIGTWLQWLIRGCVDVRSIFSLISTLPADNPLPDEVVYLATQICTARAEGGVCGDAVEEADWAGLVYRLIREANAERATRGRRWLDTFRVINSIDDTRKLWKCVVRLLPWPAGNLCYKTKPFMTHFIYPLPPGHRTWRVAHHVLCGKVTIDLPGAPPPAQVTVKFKHTLAGLIIRVCSQVFNNLRPVGQADERILAAISPWINEELEFPGFLYDHFAMQLPWMFQAIQRWQVVDVLGRLVPLDTPLMLFYDHPDSEFPSYLGGATRLAARFDLASSRVDLNTTLTSYPDVEGHIVSKAAVKRLKDLRTKMTAVINCQLRHAVRYGIAEDLLRAMRPHGQASILIQELPHLFLATDRLLSVILQSAHPLVATWAVATLTLHTPARPPWRGPMIEMPDDVREMWPIIRMAARVSPLMNFVPSHQPRNLVESFYEQIQHRMALRMGGHDDGDVYEYFPHLGWLCAYQLIVRSCLPTSAPSVNISLREMNIQQMVGFTSGFDMILDFATAQRILMPGEIETILRVGDKSLAC